MDPDDISHTYCPWAKGVSWPWPKVISLMSRSQCTHTQILCPGHNSMPCWIWIIFHTIVVHGPRVCHDLDPRSYLQGQGHIGTWPKPYPAHNSSLSCWILINISYNRIMTLTQGHIAKVKVSLHDKIFFWTITFVQLGCGWFLYFTQLLSMTQGLLLQGYLSRYVLFYLPFCKMKKRWMKIVNLSHVSVINLSFCHNTLTFVISSKILMVEVLYLKHKAMIHVSTTLAMFPCDNLTLTFHSSRYN